MNSVHGRQWYAANRERKLAYQRAYRVANHGERIAYDRSRWLLNREEMIARERDRYAQHRDHRLALRRARDARNRDLVRAQRRAWYAANREKCLEQKRSSVARYPDRKLAHNAVRRARLHSAPVVEKVNRLDIYDRDGGICHLCGLAVPREKFHLDHVMPLSKGGAHTAANLATAHPRCNISKKDRIVGGHAN